MYIWYFLGECVSKIAANLLVGTQERKMPLPGIISKAAQLESISNADVQKLKLLNSCNTI